MTPLMPLARYLREGAYQRKLEILKLVNGGVSGNETHDQVENTVQGTMITPLPAAEVGGEVSAHRAQCISKGDRAPVNWAQTCIKAAYCHAWWAMRGHGCTAWMRKGRYGAGRRKAPMGQYK